MANVAEADAPLLGLTLAGKYTLEEVVGIGAMGSVYRAAHLTLDKDVAVKVLHPSLAQHPSFVERFKREAFSASRLDHPNSLRVLDFGEDPQRGLVYIVLDYVKGEDLLAVMQREWPFDDERIVNILAQTLAALAVAHDLGIVHRDLKPENILLLPATDDEGRNIDLVKVCDFGIAKIPMRAVEEGRPFASHLTTEGLIIGTPDYMSPEQARGLDVDGRSDLYSIGCVLYHLLAGRTPFVSESPLGIAIQHVSDAPVPPSKIRPTNPQLEAICLRALSKKPEDRYPSAREMRRALRLALGQNTSLMPTIVPSPIAGGSSLSVVPAPPGLPSELSESRFSSSTAPTEVTAEHAVVSASRPWKRAVLLAAGAMAIGATLLILGSPRSVRSSGLVIESAAPAPGLPSIVAPPANEPVGAATSATSAMAALALQPESAASAELVDARDTLSASALPASAVTIPGAPPALAARPVAVIAAPARPVVRRALPQRRTDPDLTTAAPTTGSTRNAAESTAAALLPQSSLPGTAAPATAETNNASAPPPLTIDRVAPVPGGPTPSPIDVNAASVSVGPISTTSGISVASVRSAIAHLALTSCYRQALRAQPNTTSLQAALTLSIDITGRVVGASLSRDGNLVSLRSCIEGEARGALVRDVDTGEGTATVSLMFNPQ